ncbi:MULTISPECIES: MarR family winged helix-turn-helix transcriptional regulator [Chelativorans]|uniref:Transcriptional regulator, MarR family n=1 Tax=Chelativorans sp. (strain BNC1) TaxID=266779 RepID=Q11AS1_CHESB|nr:MULTISPECIES: MarR family winged helix-turn-helix transcriptional regulator [Chelativorans]
MAATNTSDEDEALVSEGVKGVDYIILDDYLPYRLLYVTAQVTQMYDERYRRELGITIPESRVIHVLARYSKISSREICRMTTLAKSRVSVALQRLEAAGILTRTTNAADQRLISLKFTKKGNILRKKLVTLAQEMEADIIRQLGKARAQDLVKTLDMMRGYFEHAPNGRRDKQG